MIRCRLFRILSMFADRLMFLLIPDLARHDSRLTNLSNSVYNFGIMYYYGRLVSRRLDFVDFSP